MKDVLISFSSRGREDYNTNLLRLIDSAVEFWQGDYLIYSPDHPLDEYRGVNIIKGWPQPEGLPSFTHGEMPYQFKYALIQEALEMGYERVVWLDTSMVLAQDVTTLFDLNYPTLRASLLKEEGQASGVTVFDNLGHPLLNYISDDAMQMLNVGAEDLLDVKQIWGGALAFDFTKANARAVWSDIKEFCLNGSFKDGGSTRPGFVAHRHDQAVLSVLVRNRCDMLPYGAIKCQQHYLSGQYGAKEDCFIVYK